MFSKDTEQPSLLRDGDIPVPSIFGIDTFVIALESLPFWKLLFTLALSIAVGAASFLLLEVSGLGLASRSDASGGIAMIIAGLVSIAFAALLIRGYDQKPDTGANANTRRRKRNVSKVEDSFDQERRPFDLMNVFEGENNVSSIIPHLDVKATPFWQLYLSVLVAMFLTAVSFDMSGLLFCGFLKT